MKSILERISSKSTFREIQEYLKQSDCCTRSSRHDYNKFIPIFTHIVNLNQINFQKEFLGTKLSNSQIHCFQKLCTTLKIIQPTSVFGTYQVLVKRTNVDDFNDLVDLYYMQQAEISAAKRETKREVNGEVNGELDENGKPVKRKYTRRKRLDDESNTVIVGKTHLHKLFDTVYYFDLETLQVYQCKITGMQYELVTGVDETPERKILLRLENTTAGQINVFTDIKTSDVQLTQKAAEEHVLSKIKFIKNE